MEENAYIEQLYRKFLDGYASKRELGELLDHFEQHGTDSPLVEQIRLRLDSEDDYDEELVQRADRIIAESDEIIHHAVKRSGKINYTTWGLLAAGLMVFLSVGIYYWRNTQPTTPQLTSIYGDDVAPGRNRATITLSDGTTVNLSETQQSVIIGQNEFTYADGSKVISAAKEIEHATLSTPRGGQYQLTLPDGSKVWLNAESSLEYPLQFTGGERKVKFTGEGYFEVAKDAEHPFVVQSENQILKVLGTEFNLKTHGAATVTTLVSGGVTVSEPSGKSIDLTPNTQSVLSGGTFEVNEVDISDYVAWKHGHIVISNATLTDVIQEVERWYDVQFDIVQQETGTAYVSLNRESPLSEVLQALYLNYGVKFKIEGRRVITVE